MNRQGIVHLRDGRGDCLIGPAAAFDRRFGLATSQDPARLGARLDHFHGRSESMAKLRRLHVALYGGGRTVQASDAEVLAALRLGLTTRRLVMVCGQPVAPLSVRRGQSLADSLAVFSQLAATVTTTAGSAAGHAIGGPAPTPSIPVAGWTLEQRIEQVLRLTQDKLPGAMRAEFAELISPTAIAITVGIIVVWAASHGTPVGPAVDIILLLVGIVALGWGIFEAASALYDFIAAVLGAKTERDLDRAAQHLARAISLLGVAAFAALLRKIGRIGRPRDRGRTTTPAPPAAETPSLPPIEVGRRTHQQPRPQQRGETASGNDAGLAANPELFSRRPVSVEPMDPQQFRRIQDAFARQGKTIDDSDDALRYLEMREAEGVTFNAETILVRPNASPSTVFEELIHATQHRTGRFQQWVDQYGNAGAVARAEYEAATKLVRNQRAYGISEVEHADNLARVQEFGSQLRRLGIPID